MIRKSIPQDAERKRAMLAQLLRDRANASTVQVPLSYGQRALWLLNQIEPHGSAYNLMYVCRVGANVDVATLSQSVKLLGQRHTALRTTYSTRAGAPIGSIRGDHHLRLETVDASNWSEEELQAQIRLRADEPFDLAIGPVIRFLFMQRTHAEPILLVTAHHIAMDFWSFDLMLPELKTIYASLRIGRKAPAKPTAVEYADYVRWQEKLLASASGERHWQYWKRQLSGMNPTLDFPTDRTRPPLQTYNGASQSFQLPDGLTERLTALAQSENATLFTTLLSAYMLLLFKYTRQTDILVGSPTAGRNHADLESLIGYFLNPIVLRGRLGPEMPFREFLTQLRTTVIEGIAHQDLPFPLLVERLSPPRDPSRSPIFQVAFAWDKPRDSGHMSTFAHELATDKLAIEPIDLGQQGAAFELMLMMLNRGNSLSGALQYNSDLFAASTASRIVQHYRTLLEDIVADPHRRIGEFRILPEAEERRITHEWNDTTVPLPTTAGVHALVEQQAQRTPDKTAVVCGGQSITFRQLDQRANQLARYLQLQGVGPETCVGVYLPRSIDLVVGLLAIWKAGAAYVPLSLTTPADRRNYMLAATGAKLVLTDANGQSQFANDQVKLVCLDRVASRVGQEAATSLPSPKQQGKQLAYVIFTSGSTGKPKGVQIEHRSVVNFLKSMQRQPGLEDSDRLLAITTITFDISVLEIWLPLIAGAQVVVAEDHIVNDGQQLKAFIEESKPSIMQATPATWRLLIEAGWKGHDRLVALCGGETFPRDLADALLGRCHALWNMYGPTETTVWSTTHKIEPGRCGSVSIGKPIANTQIHLLDEQMRPVPIGVPGNLFIGGAGLARGYHGRPDLTSERFVTWHREDGEKSRLYDTGDLARYVEDGEIEFLGRRDGQIKLRGFRIELGEIEANLHEHPQVRDAVVALRQRGSTDNEKYLVGYLICEQEQPSHSRLRDFLKRTLPDYMVPTQFVFLDAFPLNAAGKVDRRALPEPTTARPDMAVDYAAPTNDAQVALAAVWQDVLNIDRVGIHDNFFELGGASLQSLQVTEGARQAGLGMTPAMLFQYPTVAELSFGIEAEPPVSLSTPTNAMEPRVNPLPGRQAESTATQHTSQDSTRRNIIIESLGVYLPTQEVTTSEVLQGCRKKVWFPLEKMTGIKSRRKAADDEFTVDLARKAVIDCLANSQFQASEIDLVICCGITRIEGRKTFTLEPNVALQLKKQCGFTHAQVFDISNACAGVFTGIRLIQAFIDAGAIQRGMVVSGEYVTAITDTAQQEIEGFMDPRLACLTVGDAGAAAIIQATNNSAEGFHAFDLYTLGAYSHMCMGQLTDQPHGGAIMHVPDAMQHTAVAVKHSVENSRHVFENSPWMPDEMDHLLMHQTSERSLKDGMRAINKAFGHPFCNNQNTINNLAHRGNTATTTHLVALHDNILNGRIQSGDNIVFGITGSGQSIGTAAYTFDDLPERIRLTQDSGQSPARVKSDVPPAARSGPSVRVHCVSNLPLEHRLRKDTLRMSVAAAERCLEKSQYDRGDIELLLFAGMTRTDYICEPAIATLLAGQLQMNHQIASETDRKTLAFDVYSGALGPLYACQAAVRMIESGQVRTAMIVSSEVELNREHFPGQLLGLQETASAILLDRGPEPGQGFGDFRFNYHLEHLDAQRLRVVYRDGKPFNDSSQVADLEERLLSVIPTAVHELLHRQGRDLSTIKAVLPPLIRPGFTRRLADALRIPGDLLVDGGGQHADLFTSSLAYSLDELQSRGLLQKGDTSLIVNVGAGLQVGCATYHH